MDIDINLNAVLLAYVLVLNLALGVYVVWQRPDARQNRAFGVLALGTAVWTIGLALAHHSNGGHLTHLRLAFAGGSVLPLGILVFVEAFARPGDRLWPRPSIKLVTPVAILMVALAFTPVMVVSATRVSGTLSAQYGVAHSLLVVYVVAVLAYSAALLLREYRTATGSRKLQVKYLLLGFSLPSALGALTNVLAPAVLRTSAFGKYGPLVSFLMIAMVAHAIIRHRLMDIRVVIRRGVVYLVAFAVAGLALGGLVVGSNAVFPDDHPFPLREILLALVVAVLFHPLKAGIQRAFDRYLYRQPYDYRRTVREASRTLSRTLDLSVLIDRITGVVGATLRPERVAIYLTESDTGDFRRAGAGVGVGEEPEVILAASPLSTEVTSRPRQLFRDELIHRPGQPGGDTRPLLAELDRIGADVVVPLVGEDWVIGVLAVGPKRSGDPFFSDDADLLATLANQSAVALQRAQTHRHVVQMNEEIQKILGTMESGVVAVTGGKVTICNPRAERMIGGSASPLRGQPLEHLPPALASLVAATIEDGQPRLQVELVLPDAAGQLVPIMCSTSPLHGVPGAVAVFNDLSRLKELEAEKRRAERLSSLEAIASGMVHEIRNPLAAVRTFSQLLPRKFRDPGFREDFSRVVLREIDRIDLLLERFRSLAAASSQPMEPTDVLAPLQAALEALQPQLDEREIRLRRVADGRPRPIQGNSSQLQQLFHNLCLNALEAMESGGELTVRVADLSERGGSTLLVEVSDTGCGIPEDLLSRIFDPFVSTKERGSGLGLAICCGIADAHRATLRARNNSGRAGSTFTLEFPVPAARAAGTPSGRQ